jgi:hypothetical protein
MHIIFVWFVIFMIVIVLCTAVSITLTAVVLAAPITMHTRVTGKALALVP